MVYEKVNLNVAWRIAGEHTGKSPIYVSEDSIFPEDGSLFGRYVTKKK